MAGGTFSSLTDAIKAIQRDVKEKDRKLRTAVRRTARAGRNDVIRNIPRAFGELAESAHVEDGAPGNSNIVVDAPHAAPVETGSRPHTPPLAPLIAWVKLRGMQGLQSPSRIGRMAGSTTAAHARRVASEFQALESNGSLDVDAPVRIARAIQRAISLHGTKPHRYMAKSIPDVLKWLARLSKDALEGD